MAAGSLHTLARVGNGEVYAWGAGGSGQLGLGTTNSRNIPTLVPETVGELLAAGDFHSVARRDDRTLIAWGANNTGQIGDTTTTTRLIPTAVNGPATTALVAAGGSHTVAVTPDGHVWTWGAGNYGQLGDGGTIMRSTPQNIISIPGVWGGTAEPTFSPGPGTYNTPQNVTVSTSDQDAVIRYTTSGVDPTEIDPVVTSGEEIVVDRTLLLKARAWSPNAGPSRVVAGNYRLQPMTPTISPASGTFTAAQIVTLASATSDAVVRCYTLDGAEPSENSALYSVPIAVSTLTTVKARAFRDGWTPSEIATVTLTFEYGVLAAPVASPGSGMYLPDQLISLSADAGAEIRYTLDDTDRTGASPIYTAPLALPPGPATLKARAFRADWGASPIGTWTYQITTDFTPPAISAHVSPSPNAAGWNNTDVVITFLCADAESGIATCSPPVTMWANQKGTIVTGEAVDNAGNRATATVVVNIDKVAPIITVHAPEEGDVVSPDTTEVEIRGNAADETSAVASVTCGSVAGTLQNQQFTCAVGVSPGANAVRIEAQDLAGNTSTRDLTFLVDDPPPPTAIEITPATMTLLPGELKELRVVDQRGRAITGGTFTVANSLIAQIEITDNVPFVRAIAGGDTTISLTREALTAEASVTVLPAGTTAIPNGTTLWSLKPLPPPAGAGLFVRGRVLRAVPTAVPDGVEQPALFYVEHEYHDVKPARVTATTWDGRALWSYSRSERVEQFAADNQGGVVLVTSGYYEGSFRTRYSVKRLDGITGAISWEHVSFYDNLSSVAIHPDGTIYTVQSDSYAASLLALEGDTGTLRARVSLGGWHRQVASAPLVRQDGRVAVVTVRVPQDSDAPTQTQRNTRDRGA